MSEGRQLMSNQAYYLYDRLFKHIEGLTDSKSKNKKLQDIYDLIKELQNFQVKLEMKNEELHNALEKLNNEMGKHDQFQTGLLGMDQNLLESIIEGTSDAIYIKDLKGRYLLFNSTAEEITGKKSSEVLGKDDTFLFPQDEAKAVMARDFSVMNDGTEQTYEETITTASGEKRTYLSTKGPLIGGNTNIIGLFGIARDITERKKAEEELKQRSALLDISYEAIFSWEYDNGILSWNKGAERLYGFSKNETIGKVSHDLLKTKFPIEFSEFMEKLYNEKMWTGELIHTTKNGSKIIVESRHQLIQDYSGKKIVIETNRDITKRKKAEKELYQNEQKLRTVFEILPIGVSIIDKNRNIVYENPALEKILDISKRGLTEKSYEKREYIRSDCTSMPNEEFPSVKAFKEKKAIKNVEMGIIKEDNSIIWTNVSAIPLSFSDWNILITTSDITERKKAEKELGESEERYRLILEAANSGVFLLDAENKIKYLNQRTMQLLGYSAHEMLDVSIKQFLDVKGQKNVHKLIKRWKKGLNALNEFKFICKDGSTFWALFAASPIIDNTGKYRGTIGVITDINARKGLEKTLIERERISKTILYDMMGMINKLMNEELKKEYERNLKGKYEFT